ncbi:unnamed protein product [Absidia cylindrospora]
MDLDVEAMLMLPSEKSKRTILLIWIWMWKTAIVNHLMKDLDIKLTNAHLHAHTALTQDTEANTVALHMNAIDLTHVLIGMIDIGKTDDTNRGIDTDTEAEVPGDVAIHRIVTVVDMGTVTDPIPLREFLEFFSQAGRVRDARIISDRNTRRSKGVGYVEFYDESTVQSALAMSGQKLLGIPVIVQLTEAEKNRLALQAQMDGNQVSDGRQAPATTQPAQKPPVHDVMDQRLYVGSVNYTLTDHDLRQVFEPYGPIDFVDLHKDLVTGRSKGFAFIQFRNVADAKEALAKMNGFELAGRNLKVGMVTEKSQQPNNGQGNGIHDSGPLDDDSAGMTLNSMSRAELMKKLAARETDLMPAAEKVTEQPPVNILPIPTPTAVSSRTILLNNMFDPADETEPDWVQELTVDIKEECQQYGAVEHIYVDPNSMVRKKRFGTLIKN